MINWRWFAVFVAVGLWLVLVPGVQASEKSPRGSSPDQPIGYADPDNDLQLWNSFIGSAGHAVGPDELALGASVGQPLSSSPNLDEDLWVTAGFWAPGADDAGDPDPIDDIDVSTVDVPEDGLPGDAPVTSFALAPVQPNPSRGISFIGWAVPHESTVRVTVHDLQGRQVAVLADGPYAVGRYRIQWNARAANATYAPGIYFVRMQSDGGVFTRRVALIQ